jgi:Leucine-rich repeat (LRR) protein
MIFFL